MDEGLKKLLGMNAETEEEDDGTSMNRAAGGSSFKRMKNAVFMLLHMLKKKQEVSQVMATVQVVVVTLQMLYFPFRIGVWHEEVVGNFLPGLEALLLESVKQSSADTGFIVFMAVLLALTAMAILGAHSMYSFSTGNGGRSLWSFWFFELLIRVCTTIMFLPILTICTSVLSCDSNDPLGSVAPCGGSIRIALILYTLTLVFLFVVFTMVMNLCLVDLDSTTKNALAKVHGRVEVAAIAVRTFLVFLFVVGVTSDSDSINIPLTIAVVLGGFVLTSLYLTYLPYLHVYSNGLQVVGNGIFLWAGICLVTSDVIGSRSDYGGVMTFFLGIVPTVCTALFLVDTRIAKLTGSKVHSALPPLEAELVLRFSLQPSRENWDKRSNEYRVAVETMFPSNAYLTLIFAILAGTVGENELLSGQLVRRAKNMATLRFDQSFLIFSFFQDRRERSQGSDNGAMSFIALQHHRKTAEEEIYKLCDLLRSLWKIMNSDKMESDSKLFSIASQIQKHMEIAKHHLTQLVQTSNGSKRSLSLYALYAEIILNDKYLALTLKRAADAADGEDEESQAMAAVTISGDLSNLGEVLDASENAPKLFGLPREQIIGRNVSNLCPSPFDRLHDEFLKRYLETNTAFVTVTREVWVKQAKHGYTMMVQLTVSSSQDDQGNLTFTGKFNRIPNTPDFICINATGTIRFFSKGMSRELGLRDVPNAHIYTFIPALQGVLGGNGGDITNVDGKSFKIEIEDVIYRVEAKELSFKLQALRDEKLVMLNLVREDGEDNNNIDGFTEFSGDDAPKSSVKNIDGVTGKAGSAAGGPKRPPLSALTIGAKDSVSQRKLNIFNFGGDDEKSGFTEEDDKSSVSTGSSSSRGGKRAHVFHATVQTRVAQEEKRLRGFYKLCRNLVIFFATVAIAQIVAQNRLYNDVLETLRLAMLSAKRSYSIVELALVLNHELMVVVPHETEEVAELIDVLPDLALNFSKDIREIHETLAVSSYTKDDPRQIDLLHGGHSVQQTTDGIHYVNSSLNNAVLSLVSWGEAFANYAANSSRTSCDQECKAILNNAPFEVLEGSRLSTTLYVERTEYLLDKVEIANYVILGLTSLVLGLIVIFRLFPILRDIRQTKDTLLSGLEHIPQATLSELRSDSRRKSKYARKIITELNSETVWEDDDDEEDQVNVNEEPQSPSSPGNRTTLQVPALGKQATTFVGGVKRIQKVVPAGEGENQVAGGLQAGHQKKKFRRASASICVSFCKLCVPLMLFPTYFAVNNMVAIENHEFMFREVGTGYWTGRMWTKFQELHLNIESPREDVPEWMRLYQDPVKYNASANVERMLGEMESYFERVMYGSEDPGGPPSTPMIDRDEFPDQYDLQYTNALMGDGCSLKDAPDDFLIHDLGFGLHTTIANFIERTKEMLRKPDEGIAVIPYLTSSCLARALEQSMFYILEGLEGTIDAKFQRVTISSVILVAMTFLVCVLMFRTFATISKELKQSQYILLMLPPELAKIPQIKAIMARSD